MIMAIRVEEIQGVNAAEQSKLDWMTGVLTKNGAQVHFEGPNGDVPILIVQGTVAARALAGAVDGKYLNTKIGGSQPCDAEQDKSFRVTQLCLGQPDQPPAPPPPPPVVHQPARPTFGAPGVYIVEVPGRMYIPRRC
jgi:hypothetical protein